MAACVAFCLRLTITLRNMIPEGAPQVLQSRSHADFMPVMWEKCIFTYAEVSLNLNLKYYCTQDQIRAFRGKKML